MHPLGQGRPALLLGPAQGFRRGDAWLAAACLAAVAACGLLPFGNPDLFWHLNAAERIVRTGAIPRSDWLSYTKAGAPWVDFEWVAQLLWLGAFKACGWWGLLGIKAGLFAAAAAVAWRTLGLYGLARSARGIWLLAWALALLPANDLRPEAFSLLLFSALWWRLERERVEPPSRLAALDLAVSAAAFALWANLHAGFAYGLLLMALAAAVAEPERRARLAALLGAGVLGSLANPAGWRLYGVLWEHARASDQLALLVREWQAATMRDPWLWPFWALLFLAFGAVIARQWRGGLPRLHAAALCLFALSADRHVRTIPYFVALAVPIAASALAEPRGERRGWRGRAAAALLLLYFAVRVAPGLSVRPFLPERAPARLAAFLESESAVLGGRRSLHPVEWGGYLAWRLGPRFPVFADGRYLFHDLVQAMADALQTPEAFEKLIDAESVDLVVLQANKQSVGVLAQLREGTRLLIRPAWLFFVPRPRWALVYFDDQSLALVRRSRVPAAWLKEHEYTLLRPGDAEGAKLMIREGNARAEVLVAERLRHDAELRRYR